VDSDIDGLDPEVARYDPRAALDGGPDGLDAYRALAPEVFRLLAPGGLAALEIGIGQAQAVETVLSAAGLRSAGRIEDAGGRTRCILAISGDGPSLWRRAERLATMTKKGFIKKGLEWRAIATTLPL
jgi:methylase of polypeptide subunit release factors